MEKKYLAPPVLEKNWLISPPGSPHEGWVQIEEDPPNSITLHEDIQAALDRLAIEFDQGEEEEEEDQGKDKPRGTVILDTTSLGGVQVVVDNWDAMSDLEGEHFSGKTIRETRTSAAMIGKTPRPSVD
jgi:calcipressin-2